MQGDAVAMVLSLLAIALFAGAAITDVRERRISNVLVVALAVLGCLRIISGTSEGPIGADVACVMAIFAAGALAFHFSLLGGGDVKLLAAATLWLGTPNVGSFLMATVLAGGVLAILSLAWVTMIERSDRRKTRLTLPYGVAIATGGILTTAGML